MFVLLRIKVLGLVEFSLCPLESFFNGLLIDFFFSYRMFSKNMDTITLHLGKAAADCQVKCLVPLRDPEFTVLHLREERDMAGQDTNFTFGRRNHDRVDRVGVDASLRGDDFKGKRHGKKTGLGISWV